MDINLVKNVINGVNLVKVGRFLVKMVKIGSFWGQNRASGQNLGKVVKKVFLKMFLKIISVRFIDINLVKNVINGVNLDKIGHFWRKLSKLGNFGGQNDVISQNLGKLVK